MKLKGHIYVVKGTRIRKICHLKYFFRNKCFYINQIYLIVVLSIELTMEPIVRDNFFFSINNKSYRTIFFDMGKNETAKSVENP